MNVLRSSGPAGGLGLGAASVALSIGAAPPMPEASRERHADQSAVNQLAVFLQRWTNTAGAEQ